MAKIVKIIWIVNNLRNVPTRVRKKNNILKKVVFRFKRDKFGPKKY